MPRVAIDYSKTIIYCISHKEIEGLDYVGSTTDFTRRKGRHKYNCNGPKSAHHHLKVYEIIRANGGWDAFQMLEIKKFPCADKREAEAEEERCRKEFQAKLNKNRAFISEIDMIEWRKQYREQNKEKILNYFEQRKDQKAEYDKQYQERNIKEIREKRKQYREDNKEKFKERRATMYICECCNITLIFEKKARHERTERHLKNSQAA